MPQVKVQYADADSIPAALKGYAGSDNSVTVWVGENVAAETNPALAQNRDALKTEKDTIQTKYNNLLTSNSDLSTEVMELRSKVASGSSMSPEDVELVNTVKAIRPGVKAKDLKTELEEVPTLRTKVTEISQREENAKLFKASGFKNEAVFMDLISNKSKNPDLEKTTIKTEKVNDKDVEVVYVDVKGTDGKIKEVKLTDYVKENTAWSPYVSMLDAAPEQQQPWIQQPPAGGGSSAQQGDDPLQSYIDSQNEKAKGAGNPLFPNATPAKTAEAKQN